MNTEYLPPLQWIDGQQARMTDLVAQWASINSGSRNIEGLDRQFEALRPLFDELGVQIGSAPLQPERTLDENGQPAILKLGRLLQAIGKPPAAGKRVPRVLLAIHMDTVFGAQDSFQNVTNLDGNRLRGPGVCDAKGGIAVMLVALLALQRSPFAGEIQWKVLINPDEEIGSPGSAAFFTRAAAEHDLALLFEPALPGGALVSARNGSGNFTLVVHGKSAHSGRNSGDGRNAIHALAALIVRIAAWQHDLPDIVVNTGFLRGGGPVNIVPDRALCRINFRVKTAGQREEIERRLAALVAPEQLPEGIRAEVHGAFHAPPKELTPATQSLLQHFKTTGALIGQPLSWRPTGGACDGNRLAAAGLPTIDSLGVRGGNIHTDQEFIELDSLAERGRLVALFLMRLAAGEIPLDSFAPPRAAMSPPLAEVPS